MATDLGLRAKQLLCEQYCAFDVFHGAVAEVVFSDCEISPLAHLSSSCYSRRCLELFRAFVSSRVPKAPPGMAPGSPYIRFS